MFSTNSSTKYWLYLSGSVILEVIGTSMMKLSHSPGFAPGPVFGLAVMYLCLCAAYYLLSLAVQRLPIGVAYAFWEGFGLLFIAAVSFVFLGEPLTLKRLLALALIMGGAALVHKGTHSSGPERAPAAGKRGAGQLALEVEGQPAQRITGRTAGRTAELPNGQVEGRTAGIAPGSGRRREPAASAGRARAAAGSVGCRPVNQTGGGLS